MNCRLLRDVLALALLALAVLVVYARVLLTPLIPASGDFLAYFTPYWQQLNQALRAGRLPLWNDLIFGGAPFLANPQTAVFYPLRWPMIFLSAEKGILLTGALHAWLAGAFGYLLVRGLLAGGDREEEGRRPGMAAWLAGLTAGLILALNGWATGLLLHPNQFSVYPWLIAAIALWEKRARPGRWPRWDGTTRRWLAGMTLVWALAFLAGHTQSFYNAVVAFGLWVLGDVGWRAVRGSHQYSVISDQFSGGVRWRRWVRRVADGWPLALAALALAGLVVAVQMLPTLELSALSHRQGGLPYRDHAALSLPPWRLGFTLLPHYARDLGMALGTEAYGEWVGYVGVAGLLLALLGLRSSRRRLRWLGLFLALMGLMLAFGPYGLLDILLYRLMPGWDLFRVPARFLVAVMLGIAILAALGVEGLMMKDQGLKIKRWDGALMAVGGGALVLLAALTRPNLPTLLGWLAVLLVFAFVLWRRAASPIPIPILILIPVLFSELYLASYVLPIQHPTAPQALRSWRTAPARIAAEMGSEPRAGACRALSLSPTTWDPGDLDDLKRIYGPYLDDWAFTDLVNATKAKEVVAPNLGMVFDIPSLDGFGGGVLPTARFVQAMELFLPPDQIVADGRLREQLSRIPDADLLSLFHVCYVIAGKNFDVWHDDIYYDLAFGETLDATHPDLLIHDMPGFPASGVGVVSHLGRKAAGLPAGTPVAQVIVHFVDGSSLGMSVEAGKETAVGEDAARPASQKDLPAVRWPYDVAGQDVIAELDFPPEVLSGKPLADRRLESVQIELMRENVSLFVRGMAVYDRASGAHATPLVTRWPWRRIHSGDVKIYRNDGVFPRAFAVEAVKAVGSQDEALAFMQSDAFDPWRMAVVDVPAEVPAPLAPAQVEVVSHDPGRVRLRYRAEGDAFLVLADAWHPGWRATLDPERHPQPLELLPADLFLCGVAVPAGEHELLLVFAPRSLKAGAVISLLALAGLAALALWRSSPKDE